MSGGYKVEPGALNEVSGVLSGAAADEVNGGVAPPEPKAGLVTPAIVGVMAHLAEQTNALSGKLSGAAEAVQTGRAIYEHAEDDAKASLPKPGPRPG